MISTFSKLCQRSVLDIEKTLIASHVLTPGKRLIDFMHLNKMAWNEEREVFQVFTRATSFLAEAGKKYHSDIEIENHRRKFLYYTSTFKIILGSPMLANAGRSENKSISACSIPPVHLSKMTQEEISRMVGEYHTRGMGTGFSLDDLRDPVQMVEYLNSVAIKEIQDGKIGRSVGNMGVLSINHPKILSFIRLKTEHPRIKEWKFNISVNMTDSFIRAWKNKEPFFLSDGTRVNSQELMEEIAKHAHQTGDPGIVFMDRINARNKTPQVGTYKTVVTCGEVSLFEGEVCQFAYLNLPKFLINRNLDVAELRIAIHTMVRLLDNAVEANTERMPNEQSALMISSLRRIGVGVCGFSELLQALGIPYDSPEGITFAKNLINFIQFESKLASILLAKERGPFSFFDHSSTRKDLFIQPFAKETLWVTKENWQQLEGLFSLHKIRNVSTTILPPSGRSSLMAGVTPSIEPPFRLSLSPFLKKLLPNDEKVYDVVRKTGSLQTANVPAAMKAVFKTASELDYKAHILMTAAFQQGIDEGISKTVNLPNEASVEEVTKVFVSAYELGLRGTTIYRDGCRDLQPKGLSNDSSKVMLDSLYGSIHISERLSTLIASPLMQRLQKIHQNGAHYLVDPRLSASRFDHSIGVMALAQILGADESTQVASLLHDVPHTAFSHVIDAVFQLPSQDYHEKMRETFLQTPLSQEAITKSKITARELNHHDIRLIKSDKDLTVDRLDYVLRDLQAVNLIFQPEYSMIINDLIVHEGIIHCKSIECARTIFKKFLEVNQKVYFCPKGEVATILITYILKQMLQAGLLAQEDFFSTDDIIVGKILKSPWERIFKGITPEIEFYLSTDKEDLYSMRKLRYIDPKILGMQGRLTDHCRKSKELLDEYLSTPTRQHYKIPLLENSL